MRTKTITTIVFLLVSMASFAKGTQNDPYSVAEACAAVSNLSWTSNTVYETTDDVYVKGVISRITDHGTYTESGIFGNASFYIKDAGGSKELYCYRLYYFGFQKFTEGQTDIEVGDEVIIYGKLMNYKNTTPETVGNQACLYKLNGFGFGTLANPYSVKTALEVASNLSWTSNSVYETTDDVYVKGVISSIANLGTYTESGIFGNASFYIRDDGGSEEFYCYRVYYLGNQKFVEGQTDIEVGDEVIICGKLMNFRNATPETVANQAYLYSLNGKIGHPTAITATIPETTAHNRYYSTSGQRIDGKPTQKGVYIMNGKKVILGN